MTENFSIEELAKTAFRYEVCQMVIQIQRWWKATYGSNGFIMIAKTLNLLKLCYHGRTTTPVCLMTFCGLITLSSMVGNLLFTQLSLFGRMICSWQGIKWLLYETCWKCTGKFRKVCGQYWSLCRVL